MEEILKQEGLDALGAELKETLDGIFTYDYEVLNIEYQREYVEMLDEFRLKYIPVFVGLAHVAEESADNKAYMASVIDHLISLEVKQEEALRKYKRGIRKTNTRLYLVLYVLPVMAETENEWLISLADTIAQEWPKRLGGAPMSYASTEKIGSKFGGDWLRRLMGRFGDRDK